MVKLITYKLSVSLYLSVPAACQQKRANCMYFKLSLIQTPYYQANLIVLGFHISLTRGPRLALYSTANHLHYRTKRSCLIVDH